MAPSRLRLVLLGGALMLASVGAAVLTASVSASSPCTRPIRRVGARGPIVGPIQFRGIRRAATPASKVLLFLRGPTHGDVVITGARCADGTRMRFWYGNEARLPDTITSSTGDLSFTVRGAAGMDYPGYLIWAKPGNWRLVVAKAGQPLGTLVFCVSAVTDSASPCR